jgi:hypothetical protein
MNSTANQMIPSIQPPYYRPPPGPGTISWLFRVLLLVKVLAYALIQSRDTFHWLAGQDAQSQVVCAGCRTLLMYPQARFVLVAI